MDYSKRTEAKVESLYQFVLRDLKSSKLPLVAAMDDLKNPHKLLLKALTMLALEDKEYYKNIVKVIHRQILKVDAAHKLIIVFLIDSIVEKRDGAKYRTLFGQLIPEIVSHVLQTATSNVRESLCKLRRKWNSIFDADVLNKLDSAVRKVDSMWPHTEKEIELMTEVKKIDEEMEAMRMEIYLLEHPEELCSDKKINNAEESNDEGPLIKPQLSKGEMDTLFDNSQIDFDLLRSSVLLTPPPEPEMHCPYNNERRSDSMKNIYSSVPKHAERKLQMMNDVKEVDREIEVLQKEIRLLEQGERPEKSNKKKRSRSEETADENPLKKRQIITTNEVNGLLKCNEINWDLIWSTVFSVPPPSIQPTPSPEPEKYYSNKSQTRTVLKKVSSRRNKPYHRSTKNETERKHLQFNTI